MHIYDPNRSEANPPDPYLPELADVDVEITLDPLGVYRATVPTGETVAFGPDDDGAWSAAVSGDDLLLAAGSRAYVLDIVRAWIERRQ